MLRVHNVHIATYIVVYAYSKFYVPSLNSFQVMKGSRFLADRQTDGLTDWRTDWLTDW